MRFLVLALVVASAAVRADWQVQPDSRVGYVSIKQNAVAENNRFTGVSGSIAADGSVEVVIDLSSVDTGVDIRNQRMQSMFFEVADFPEARVTAQLDPVDVAQLAAGAPMERDLMLRVDLHGMAVEVPARLRALKVNEVLHVQTVEPILLSAGSFGLEAGVAGLQEVAGLAAISRAVPVFIDLKLREVR